MELAEKFRLAGGRNNTMSDNINTTDSPGQQYFRIFFDFTRSPLLAIDSNTQVAQSIFKDVTAQEAKPPHLSTETGEEWNNPVYNQNYISREDVIGNTALNYLMVNGEWERSAMLVNFVRLLANISMDSPWYFQTVEGLGEAMKREVYHQEAFNIPEPKVINIKCLPDAYDTRIGTLLDLYRYLTVSQNLHKLILPANLRRFNMYIYIFNAPLYGLHIPEKNPVDLYKSRYAGRQKPPHPFPPGKDARMEADTSQETDTHNEYAVFTHDIWREGIRSTGSVYVTNSKLIELKDCEFSIDSSITGYESLSNTDGFNPEFTIGIKVNSVREQRFNEFLNQRIGDLVLADLFKEELSTDSSAAVAYPGDSIRSVDDSIKAMEDISGNPSSIANETFHGHVSINDSANREIIENSKNADPYNINKGTLGSLRQGRKEGNGVIGNLTPRLGNNLSNIWVDRDKPIGMDPYSNMPQRNNPITRAITGQIDKLGRQVATVAKSVYSTIDSYSPKSLGKLGAAAIDGIFNRVEFGNIFDHGNFDRTLQNVAGAISELSSYGLASNLADHVNTPEAPTTSFGWSRLGTNMGDEYNTPETPELS